MIKLTRFIREQLQVELWRIENRTTQLMQLFHLLPGIERETGALDEMQVSEIKHYWLKFLKDDVEKNQ